MSAATTLAEIKAERALTEAAKIYDPLPADPENGTVKMGEHVITSAETTAATLSINTGLSIIGKPVFMMIDGTTHAVVAPTGLIVTVAGGTITIAVGTGALTTGVSIVYWVRGY